MLTAEFINSTMNTIDLTYSNVTEVLHMDRSHGMNTQYYNNIRHVLLVMVGMLSEMGYIIALLFFYYFGDKSSSSYCTVNLFISGLLIGYVPMLIESTFQTEGTDFWKFDSFCGVEKMLRALFAIFSNYMLVVLALNCYSISVRNICVCPKFLSKFCAILIAFYFICSVPSLMALALADDQAFMSEFRCTPYFSYKMHSYPKHILMIFLLFFIYIIPLFLMIGIFSTVLFKLLNRSRYRHVYNRTLLSPSDVKYIWMTFTMFLTFLITNVPFIFQGLLTLLANCPIVNPVTAVFLEVLSISNTCLNPYIYLMFELGNVRKVCVSLIKEDCDGKAVSDVERDDVDYYKLLPPEKLNCKSVKVRSNIDI